jgi:hypothetical protein
MKAINERKEKFQTLAREFSQMSEEERAKIATKMPLVCTIDGRALSKRNSVLLQMQTVKPVTIVGGFNQWRSAGRHVRSGEKALYIMAPSVRQTKEGLDDTYFVSVAVFDVAQTDGPEETVTEYVSE